MYNTFLINDNGDIEFDSLGQLVMLDGSEALAQTITHKLKTIEGKLFYSLQYGVNKRFIQLKKSEANLANIEDYLNSAISDDARVKTVKVNNLYKDDNDNIGINMSIILQDDTILNLTFNGV